MGTTTKVPSRELRCVKETSVYSKKDGANKKNGEHNANKQEVLHVADPRIVARGAYRIRCGKSAFNGSFLHYGRRRASLCARTDLLALCCRVLEKAC